MEGVADLAALCLDEGVAHTASDDEVVDLVEHVLEHCELGRDLRAADDSGEGVLCVLKNVVDSLDLAFHQVAEHLVLREVVCDEGGRSVGAVSRAECIVDVAVGIRSEGLDELLLGLLDSSLCCFLLLVGSVFLESAGFAFLLSIEAEVFEKQDLTGLEGVGLGLSLLAIFGKLHGNSEELAHAADDVLEGELGVDSLRASEVGHDDKGTASCEDLLEGRDCGTDTGVVGDFELLVERDVEVYAHDGLLACEIIRINEFLHML